MAKYTAKIVGTKILTPTSVSGTKGLFGRSKTMLYKGLHYSFNTGITNGYSLELFVMLCPELEQYGMVFVRDTQNEVWLGVFVGVQRPTVIIYNENFYTHLRRYAVILTKPIAIINAVVDAEDVEVDFVAIEKEPKLIDPDQNSRALARYGTMSMVVFGVISALYFTQASIEEKIAESELKRPSLIAKTAEIMLSNRQSEIFLSSDEKQDKIMKEIGGDMTSRMPTIHNEALLWQ